MNGKGISAHIDFLVVFFMCLYIITQSTVLFFVDDQKLSQRINKGHS